DAALRAAVRDKRVLQRMSAAEPFNRRHTRPTDLRERHETRVDGQAVNQHGTGAALAFATPFLRTGEVAGFAQHVEQTRHRMRAHVPALAVQREAHAAMIFSGVAGISLISTPACLMALTTAG